MLDQAASTSTTTTPDLAARTRAFEGVLLGTLVGDAIGLPFEGLSASRIARLLGPSPLGHRFLFRRGMASDDTEHACMTAQALLASHGDRDRFTHSLAWRLRGWLLGLPAGVGYATLRAIVKLWLGFRPGRSAMFWPGSGVNSAGNGPAMRAPVIGVYCGSDIRSLLGLVQSSTQLTHTDRRAYIGSVAVAAAVAYAAQLNGQPLDPDRALAYLQDVVHDRDLCEIFYKLADALRRGDTARDFAATLGLSDRVTGYIYHTVPIALFCWLRWPTDFRAAIEAVVRLGGDTDSVAAIAGALIGATSGPEAIPQDWLAGIAEWPRSVEWIRRLAQRLATPDARPLPLFWPGLALRNPPFLLTVLLHGFRRLLPPY